MTPNYISFHLLFELTFLTQDLATSQIKKALL